MTRRRLGNSMILMGIGEPGPAVIEPRQATLKLNNFNDQFIQTGSWFGVTICSGDSGGPVFMKTNGTEYIVGVNSYGFIGCIGEGNSARPDTNWSWIKQFVR